MDEISRSDDGRIVMVSSSGYSTYATKDMTFKSLEDVNKPRGYLKRYGTSPFLHSRIHKRMAVDDRTIETCNDIV